jgi:hypothetical protein
VLPDSAATRRPGTSQVLAKAPEDAEAELQVLAHRVVQRAVPGLSIFFHTRSSRYVMSCWMAWPSAVAIRTGRSWPV